MRNVIYIGAFRFPQGDAAASRVLNNGKLLKELDYNITFISWGGEPRQVDRTEGGYFYDGFKYINTRELDRRDNVLRRLRYHILKGKYTLRYILSEHIIDGATKAIIIYNSPLYFSIMIRQLCNDLGIHLISDITEWYAPYEYPGGRMAPFYWLNELNMRFIQKKIKNKILVSSFLNSYYKASNNIVLPPLVDSNEKKWQRKEPLFMPFNGLRLIYAGSSAENDLIKTMLKVILKCIKGGLRIQLIILGISRHEISNFSGLKEIASFPNNFFFCGRVPQEVVPAYYHLSDFSLIIRKRNKKNMAGFPTKLVESMMSGCPVISNDVSDIAEYVKDGYNGYLMTGWSSNELEKTLRIITNLSREEIFFMKDNARRSAEKYFDYSVYINSMINFINHLK